MKNHDFFSLSPLEAILLFNTLPENLNDSKTTSEAIIISSKSIEVLIGSCITYLAAIGVFGEINEKISPDKLKPPNNYDCELLISGVHRFFSTFSEEINLHRIRYPDQNDIVYWHVISDILESVSKDYDFNESFLPHPLHITGNASYTLEKKGYIDDPIDIVISGWLLVFFGIVPYTFNKRTKKGEKIVLETKALFWDLEIIKEYDKKEDKYKASGWTFNISIVKAFQESIQKFILDVFR